MNSQFNNKLQDLGLLTSQLGLLPNYLSQQDATELQKLQQVMQIPRPQQYIPPLMNNSPNPQIYNNFQKKTDVIVIEEDNNDTINIANNNSQMNIINCNSNSNPIPSKNANINSNALNSAGVSSTLSIKNQPSQGNQNGKIANQPQTSKQLVPAQQPVSQIKSTTNVTQETCEDAVICIPDDKSMKKIDYIDEEPSVIDDQQLIESDHDNTTSQNNKKNPKKSSASNEPDIRKESISVKEVPLSSTHTEIIEKETNSAPHKIKQATEKKVQKTKEKSKILKKKIKKKYEFGKCKHCQTVIKYSQYKTGLCRRCYLNDTKSKKSQGKSAGKGEKKEKEPKFIGIKSIFECKGKETQVGQEFQVKIPDFRLLDQDYKKSLSQIGDNLMNRQVYKGSLDASKYDILHLKLKKVLGQSCTYNDVQSILNTRKFTIVEMIDKLDINDKEFIAFLIQHSVSYNQRRTRFKKRQLDNLNLLKGN